MKETRTCTLCKKIKHITDFFWDKRFNIPFSRCKPCYNAKCSKYRKSTQGKKIYADWVKSENGKKIRTEAMAKWRANNAQKRRAQNAISNAIRDGRLIRMPCVVCGEPDAEGHHPSYKESDFLNVIWLCKTHHTLKTYIK